MNDREAAERRIMSAVQTNAAVDFFRTQRAANRKSRETNQTGQDALLRGSGFAERLAYEFRSRTEAGESNSRTEASETNSKSEATETKSNTTVSKTIIRNDRLRSGEWKCPYNAMAKDGIIEYNGVIFQCDYRRNAITLGDMSDERKVLNISLPSGGSLKVNVDSFGEISKAAGMFTPEDLNAIMRALHQYNHLTHKLYEIEEEEDETVEEISGVEDVSEKATIAESETISDKVTIIESEIISKKDEVTEVKSISLENMLKAKYPNLVYNVGDGSTSYWRTRNDFPFEYLFRESEDSGKMLESWQPSGANPTYQRYIATAPGSKAVMIHPKAQERIEKDPEFAKEVMDRIEAWWKYDIARNEAIAPGYTAGMSQAIAIGEDGEITNVLSCGGGDSFHRNRDGKNGNGKEEEYDWWTERRARHIMYMQLWLTGKADFGGLSSVLGARGFGTSGGGLTMGGFLDSTLAQAAEAEIHDMIDNGNLREILGDTVCGESTDAVISHTWSEIEQGRSIRRALAGYGRL